MTITAYSYVEQAAQSGGWISWLGLSTLTTSTTNKAYRSGDFVVRFTNTITAHTPEFMDTLGDGATLNALNVKFKAYNAAGSGGTAYFYITENGTKRSEWTFTDLTNTGVRTYAGNPAYWGLTASPKQNILDLASGAIKLQFYIATGPVGFIDVALEDFQVQVDYSLPDTQRAALLIPLA